MSSFPSQDIKYWLLEKVLDCILLLMLMLNPFDKFHYIFSQNFLHLIVVIMSFHLLLIKKKSIFVFQNKLLIIKICV